MFSTDYCFYSCDNLTRPHYTDPFSHSDRNASMYKIGYNVGLTLLQLGIFAYFLTPVLFRYSLRFRRHILFTHSVNYSFSLYFSVGSNFTFRRNYYEPNTHDLQGGRSFYLQSSFQERHKIGVWHILPESFARFSDGKPAEYWDHVLRTSKKPIIIYFHGSIGSRVTGNRIHLYNILQEKDYHVIAFDYRGFGDSTQILPSETRAVQDGHTVLKWLRGILKEEILNVPIFFWGHSMGTGIASHLASKLASESDSEPDFSGSPFPLKGLVLEAPFTNMKEEIRVYPVAYIFNFFMPVFDWFFVSPLDQTDILLEVDRHIVNIKSPVLILHAFNDPIVPYHLGKKLFSIARSSRSEQEAKQIHFAKFTEFSVLGAHDGICHSPKLPSILDKFSNSCIQNVQDAVRN